jgi:predicted nucleic acid-binding protein
LIVADTNLLANLLIASPDQVTAEEVLRRDPEWAAPVLWRSEFRNVLATNLRRGTFGLADALQMMADAEALVSGREYAVDSAPVLAMAYGSGCTAYDSEFAYLAQLLGLKLVTSDRKLLQEFPQLAVSPEDFIR